MGNELAIPHGTNETKHTILDSALSVVRYDGGRRLGRRARHVRRRHRRQGRRAPRDPVADRDPLLGRGRGREASRQRRRPEELFALVSERGRVDEGRPLRRGQHRARLRRAAPARGRLRARLLGCRGPARRRDQRASPSTPCTRSARAAATRVVTGFRAINSATHPDEVVDEIADGERRDDGRRPDDPQVRRAAHRRRVSRCAIRPSPPLQIMACENAINATDLLRDEIAALAGEAWDALAGPRGLRQHRGRPDRARPSRREPAST